MSEPVHTVHVRVNGQRHERVVRDRVTLGDFLRRDLGLTGTHLGCEHGVCGACTVLVDARAVRSCLLLAVQVDGREVTTVEGLTADGTLSPLQEAFRSHHALQCGFCTAGILMGMTELLEEEPAPDEVQVRSALSGHLCRCTGYQGIVTAVLQVAADRVRARRS